MATTLSATSIRFTTCSLRQSLETSQLTGRVKFVSVGWAKNGFPSLRRSSCLRVSCAAKPETVQRVVDIVKNQLALPADSALTPESKFSDLGADSLDTVEIVMGLEEAFDISVEEENSQNITTVGEAADLIEDLIQKKGEA